MLATVATIRNTLPLVVTALALVVAPDALGSPVKIVDLKKVEIGETVTLLKNPNFKVTGECVDNGGGDFTAESYVAARRNNLRFDSYNGDPFDADFDRNDGPATITKDGNGAATGTMPALEAADYYEFYAEGQKGAPLQGRIASGVHFRGADCTFSARFVGGESGGTVEAEKRKEADAGDKVTLFSNDDFKVTGKCQDNGGGDLQADTFIAAKRSNLVLFLTEEDGSSDPDFDPNDGKVDFLADEYEAYGTTPVFAAESYTNDVWTEGKGGKVMQARIGTSVHTQGADCAFSGIFVGPGGSNGLRMVDRIEADAGENVKLFQTPDFRVTGKCLDNGGGDFTADTVFTARRDNLAHYTYNGDPGYDLDFDKADGAVDIGEDATGTTPDYKSYDDYAEFYGFGKGKTTLTGRLGSGIHIGNADCTFSGMFLG